MAAKETIRRCHYTHTVPSGKSHYVVFGDAIVVWSIPANKNIAAFLGGGAVWELARLWAPDGHAPNLLTQAISAAVRELQGLYPDLDALVSYADPNQGHGGGIYKPASWLYDGQSEESRVYIHDITGQTVSRRAFHSGSRGMRKAEIEALGYTQLKLPGKLRFVRLISRRAKRNYKAALLSRK